MRVRKIRLMTPMINISFRHPVLVVVVLLGRMRVDRGAEVGPEEETTAFLRRLLYLLPRRNQYRRRRSWERMRLRWI